MESLSPHFLSVTFDHSGYQWQDEAWQTREIEPICKQAISVYEVHLGSWMPTQDESISVYRHLADTLAPYVAEMGYTHICWSISFIAKTFKFYFHENRLAIFSIKTK